MKEHTKNTQKTSVYFPAELHMQIAKSAEKHRRSFNQQLLWLVETGLKVEQQLDSELETNKSSLVKERRIG